jgi:hypothetical protein
MRISYKILVRTSERKNHLEYLHLCLLIIYLTMLLLALTAQRLFVGRLVNNELEIIQKEPVVA